MNTIFNINGLMFWNSHDIKLRKTFEEYFQIEVSRILLNENKAWQFIQIEAPILTPRTIINQNYQNSDIWVQQTFDNEQELVLRPETTPGSYTYATNLLESNNIMPPFVIWQSGKSFRREQDQVSKNMRLKEFYQQEFQCIYAKDTANDYHSKVLEPVRKMIFNMLRIPTRLIESDRLPSYSLKTIDVEVQNKDKWMEVCSISLRTDFPIKAKFSNKKNEVIEKELLVLEIAIGLDRCVYNWNEFKAI